MKELTSLITALTLLVSASVNGQTGTAYKIFHTSGEEVSFSDMTEALAKGDVVLFGEQHNSAIDHWLQLEVTKSLNSKRDILLGAEMFESDDQVVLDEYLASQIKDSHFKKEAKMWPNYDTDYAPLVEFAKINNLDFIATNTPRRYASLVSRNGIEGLSELSKEAKSFLPKLPYEVTPNDIGYDLMREMMGGHGMGMNLDNLVAAQALKDYTMAYNIAKYWKKDALFLHFNGTFHSDYHSGIYNYLIAEKKKLNIITIASVEAEDGLEWDLAWSELADYIIVKPESMTKTH